MRQGISADTFGEVFFANKLDAVKDNLRLIPMAIDDTDPVVVPDPLSRPRATPIPASHHS
jgi:hypothetical protein